MTIPARDPKPGAKSWAPSVALASADPANWKVTADEVKPGADLKSYVALELRMAGGAAFARPDAAQAAVIDQVAGPNNRIDGLVDPVIEERQIDPAWEGYKLPSEKGGK